MSLSGGSAVGAGSQKSIRRLPRCRGRSQHRLVRLKRNIVVTKSKKEPQKSVTALERRVVVISLIGILALYILLLMTQFR